MPDHHAAAGRFIPASELDFNRYAKHFAWLSNQSLSAAKEGLAELYGFASVHELRQVLKKGHPPGPFSSAPNLPLFQWEPRIEGGPDCLPLEHPVHQARTAKLWDFALNTDDHRLMRRQIGALEAGLFCQPKVHRALFDRVAAGLKAFEAPSPDAAEAWARRQWPIGYWALLDLLYAPPVENEAPYKKLQLVSGLPLARAYEELWQYQAPLIYLRATRFLYPDAPQYARAAWAIEYPRKTNSEHGLFDFKWVTPAGELPAGLNRYFGAAAEGTLLQLFNALDKGDCDLSRYPCVQDRCSQVKRESMESELRNERFGNLVMKSDLISSGHGLVAELMTVRSYWPRTAASQEVAAILKKDPLAMLPSELINQRIADQDWLTTYLSLRPADHAEMAEELSVQVLTLNASFYRDKEGVTPLKPGALIGAASGYLLVPFDRQYRCDAESWFDVLDNVSPVLNDVWKVLQTDYFPRKGMNSIEDFSDLNPFTSIAVLSIELLPEYRGQGLVPSLLRGIVHAVEEHPNSRVDPNWYNLASVLSYDQQDIDWEFLPESTGRLLGEVGVVIIQIEGAEPPVRIIEPGLNRSLYRIRKDPNHPKERQKQKLMAHFKAMEPELVEWLDLGGPIDIVCYDPHEWPMT